MNLKEVDLNSRTFLMYFYLMQKEFGHVIPWMKSLDEILFSTNERFFNEIFREKTLNVNSKITSHIYYDNTESQNMVGGILHLEKSPERFKETFNNDLLTELESSDEYSYITGFLLRPEYRKKEHGSVVFKKTLYKLLKTYEKLWGVFQEEKLILYYKSFGFKIKNVFTKEKLYIITLDSNDFII